MEWKREALRSKENQDTNQHVLAHTKPQLCVQGQRYQKAGYWFTDAYEKREGRWQIVWSQVTGIVS